LDAAQREGLARQFFDLMVRKHAFGFERMASWAKENDTFSTMFCGLGEFRIKMLVLVKARSATNAPKSATSANLSLYGLWYVSR
jgi:hypothetical protein